MLSAHLRNSYYYSADEIKLVAECLKQLSISEINQLLIGPLFGHPGHGALTQLQRQRAALLGVIVTKEIID